MLSLDGSQITFEAVLKSQDNVAGMAYDSTPFNTTALGASPPMVTAGISQNTQVHPVALIPSVPADNCNAHASAAPAMAYSMLAPVHVGEALAGPEQHPSPMQLTVDASLCQGVASRPETCIPVSPSGDLGTGYIPSCTRPYGMTIDELLAAWPEREWCAAPTRTEVENLVRQCQGLNKQYGSSLTPKVTQFGLPTEQLVYALAMLANWDCARIYQILTTIDVDFRAIALRLPQAGLWFRCQPTIAEAPPGLISSTTISSQSHTKVQGFDTSQPAEFAQSVRMPFQPETASAKKAAYDETSPDFSDQIASLYHEYMVHNAKQRRETDCSAVKVCSLLAQDALVARIGVGLPWLQRTVTTTFS